MPPARFLSAGIAVVNRAQNQMRSLSKKFNSRVDFGGPFDRFRIPFIWIFK
jgi:hypothetical protein